MVRQRRIYYENAVYHITFRGNNKQRIFDKEENKKDFLESLAKFKLRHCFKVYGLCLMDNHGHLVVEAGERLSISKIMQAVLLSYSLKFRRKYNYVGHVFQGRFNSSVVRDGRYILECIEYVHNNPVRAKMVAAPQEYAWSSYCFYYEIQNKVVDPLIKFDRYGDTSLTTY
jgi:REP element-mobilizing transposase RayT